MIKIDHTRSTQETPPDRPRDNNNTLATPRVKETRALRALRALLSCVLCQNQRVRQYKVLFYWNHWLSYRGKTVSGWFG